MRIILILTVISFGFFSCQSDTLLDTKTDLPELGWAYEQIPAFEFEINDVSICYNVFLNIQISEEYLYRNIYLLVHLRNPDGKDVTNRINVELANASGKWLGSGSGNLKSFKLPIRSDLCFEKAGRYTIGLEQNMRDSLLQHVNYIGISLTKGNPVF